MLSTYMFCTAEEKSEAERAACVGPTIKVLVKKIKSSALLLLLDELPPYGEKISNFSDIWWKVLRTYDLTPETNNYDAGK